MSKRDLSSVASLIAVATPAPRGAGRYEVRLDGKDRVWCVSRMPFLDAARALIAAGHMPMLFWKCADWALRHGICAHRSKLLPSWM